jgi:DNA-binding GntR family transcriptional regulator
MTLSIELASNQTRAGQIRDALIAKILSGELPSGARLKDNEVAKMFGTSATPVREALRELEKYGLVEILPYRGCQVKRLDAQEISDIYEVRIALEELAVRRCAEHASEEQLQALEALADEYEATLLDGDMRRAVETGGDFHSLLVEVSGNLMLTEIHRELHNRILLTRHIDPLPGRLTGAGDHRAIVEALRRHDADKAATLLARHIVLGRDRVLQMMALSSSE